MDAQASLGPRGEAQDVLRPERVAVSGTDAVVEEEGEGRSRHSVDCETSAGDRSVGLREGSSGRMGAKDGGSGGRGRPRAHVVDPWTDSDEL
jgi:hypothetical protein